MIVVVLALFGLIFGSFINALVWRLHAGRDWVRERSECLQCHHPLAPKDLIPVLSWLMLRGKCRYCHKPIPDSPLVELAVPALFVLSYVFWPVVLTGAAWFGFVCWLVCLVAFVALAAYDLRWYLLPDVIVFPLIGLTIFQVLVNWLVLDGTWRDVTGSLIGVGVISGTFYILYTMSKGKWIGFGDVKLGVALGLLAGGAMPALLVLFLSSLIGLLVAAPLVVQGKANRKSHLPFGPLLIVATIAVVLFGDRMLDWYAGLILPT